MSSKLKLSKQGITELEAENFSRRIKLSVSDAEIGKYKRRNNKFLSANKEYNERRASEVTKDRAEDVQFKYREKKLCFSASGQAQESLPTHLKEKMSQDLNSVTQPCNSTSLEEKICSELDSKCKKEEGVDKLKQELFAPQLPSQVPIEQNHVTKIFKTASPGKSSIDEVSQHLA